MLVYVSKEGVMVKSIVIYVKNLGILYMNECKFIQNCELSGIIV